MIEIRDMSLTYQGPKGPVEALKHINLRVEKGEIFGIIGRSGAGKSSLVRCINLLNRPTSGQMMVDGNDLMQLSDAQLRAARHQIGMVFQHFNLLSSRTVYDNAALPLELAGMSKAEIKKRIDPLLEHWLPTPRCCSVTRPLRRWTLKPPVPFWICCARSTASWA